jgi:hypothetical protein
MSYDRLIAEKFPDRSDRQTVQALVASLPATMRSDHITALIYELAQPTEKTGEECVNYIASFIGALGALPHEAQAFVSFVDAGDTGVPALAEPELPSIPVMTMPARRAS